MEIEDVNLNERITNTLILEDVKKWKATLNEEER